MTNTTAYQVTTENYGDIMHMMYQTILHSPKGITIYLPKSTAKTDKDPVKETRNAQDRSSYRNEFLDFDKQMQSVYSPVTT
jgi:hypothetical protein